MFIKLIKVGSSIFEIKDNQPIVFKEYLNYKRLGLVYPFMILFVDNIKLEDKNIEHINRDKDLLMLSYDLKNRLQYKYNKKHTEFSTDDKIEIAKDIIDDYINLMNNIEHDYFLKGDKCTIDDEYNNDVNDESDNEEDDIPYKKILSIMVLITLKTGIRIGKDYHYQQTGSVGLSTLRKEHLTFNKDNIEFNFIGKKGVSYYYKLTNNDIGNNIWYCVLKDLYDNTDDFIFKYNERKINYNDVNLYIKEKTLNKNLSGKDFRTLLANISFLKIFINKLKINIKDITKTQLDKTIKESINETALILQNTNNVSKKYYVFEKLTNYILDLFNDNSLLYILKFENNIIGLLKEIFNT